MYVYMYDRPWEPACVCGSIHNLRLTLYTAFCCMQLQYAQSECYLDTNVCTVHVEILVQVYSDKN